MKLVRMDFKLEIPEGYDFSYQKSSLMHGVLLEQLDSEFVEVLHRGGYNPYAQHLEKRANEWYWVITIFSNEAYQEMYSRLSTLEKIYVRHDKKEIRILEKKIDETDSEQLINQYYFSKCPRTITVRFKTPTAFKQNGYYTFYPDIRCILQSMNLKYDSVTAKEGIIAEEMLDEMVNNMRIVQYNLKSCSFQMEGVKIPSYLGEVKFAFKGTQTLVNYIHFLFRFACYSGVGIKTSLGMGAIEIQENGK